MFACIVAKSTRFTCETHDGPGACTQECLDLVCLMDSTGDYGQTYDPTGCRYYPEPPAPEYALRDGGVFVTFFSEPVQ